MVDYVKNNISDNGVVMTSYTRNRDKAPELFFLAWWEKICAKSEKY